jgi:hypothetical protein
MGINVPRANGILKSGVDLWPNNWFAQRAGVIKCVQ